MNGNRVSLSGYNLSVKLIVYNQTFSITDYAVTENVITFTFDGTKQEKCGLYTLLCQYTDSSGALHTIDSVKAFELVPHTNEEGGLDNSNLALEVVQLSTDIDSSTIGKAATIRVDSVETLEPDVSAYARNTGNINDAALKFGIPRGKDGLSAYEVAKNEGFSGTKAEWLESLKGKLNPVLDSLDKSELGLGSLPSLGGSVYYNGKSWEWKNGLDEQSLSDYLSKNNYATKSWVQTWVKSQNFGTGAGNTSSGATADITKYQWWGRSFSAKASSDTNNSNKVISGYMDVYGPVNDVTNINFTNSEFSVIKTLRLDDNGDLCFNGNFYATGGITALGSGGGSSSSGSGTSDSSVLDIPLYDSDSYSATVNVTSGKVALVAGDGVTLEKTTKTDSDNETIPAIKISSSGGGSGGSFSGTTSYPLTIYKGSTGTDCITFNGSTARYLRFGDGLCVEESGLGYIISASGGGSGSISVSGTDSNGGTNYLSGTKIRLQIVTGISVVNVTKDPKDTTNGVLVSIPYSSSSGSSGTTGSSTVYWDNIQSKPSTLSGYGITSSDTLFDGKYLGASANAVSATKLVTARTIWGQSFNGTANITGDMTSVGNITFSSQAPAIKWTGSNSQICDGYMDLYATVPYIDFHYNKSSNDYSARLIASADNQLELVTNSGTGTFNFNSNKLKIGNGTLEWDSTNSCFKINGSVYATGGITTLGVSNSSTTTNNVDFTFKTVKANSYSLAGGSSIDDGAYLQIYASNGMYIAMESGYGEVDQDWQGNVIDSKTMSFRDADWYFFDSDLCCHKINTNKLTLYNSAYSDSCDLEYISYNSTTKQLTFTVNGTAYKVQTV